MLKDVDWISSRCLERPCRDIWVITGPSYSFPLVAHRQMNNAAEWTRNENAKTQAKHFAPGVVPRSLELPLIGSRPSGPLRERGLIEPGANEFDRLFSIIKS